jgi:HEAT repeat protein
MIIFAESAAAPWEALDRVHSSFAVLAGLVVLGVAAFVLLWFGVVGAVLGVVGAAIRGGVGAGFRVWEALFSAAPWPVFLGCVLVLIGIGVAAADPAPAVAAACGAAALFMGVTACLAYMAVDLERYEVERGYKAVHEPLKGQVLATNLIRYGERVGVPLLGAAAVAAVGGFALLNLGLYGAGGRGWYAIGGDNATPGFVDFLAYTLVNLYRIVDLLDVAGSYNLPRFTFVRQVRWPAATLLAGFKTFFTLVLLQQIFASVRQGQALAEAVADFWSPHAPIHERARNSLPQFGVGVVGPLLESLRTVPALTKEQRDQLPRVIAGIGPATVPTLVAHLGDAHEGVRAVTAAALGRLHALDALPGLAGLAADPSEFVRQEVATALGAIGGPGARSVGRRSRVAPRGHTPRRSGWALGRRREAAVTHDADKAGLALTALRTLTTDPAAAVRVAAAEAAGLIGPAATPLAADLVGRLKDADETVRCRAAEALGRIADAASVPALAAELEGPGPAVREAAARALGAFGPAAGSAIPALLRLLQDPEESVRQAAGEAVGRVGPLPEEATATLVEGLTSGDTLVRAQTAEALGAIGEGAADAAPALAEALTNGTDHVRAKAAEALGKIGETAAEVAVPVLVRALRDNDNWVSALAAEALGEMGEAAGEAVPALVRSLHHINPIVRANAAEAVGKLGEAGAAARPALEAAAADPDGAVRAAALRALGAIAPPGSGAGAVVLAGLRDPDPRTRAAAAEAAGALGTAGGEAVAPLLPLLEDANDEVKFQVIRSLPRLAGPTPEVVDGLCRRLLEDDSMWVREAAAQALGPLGPEAAAAGPALLRAARTGEAAVREAAVRATTLIQPPEAAEVFTGGLADASPEVRKVASAGWMKAAGIPETAVPALVDALHDPEVQVRANAAHALARLDTLPPAAVPLLEECAADPNDGLRLNAVVALRGGAGGAAAATLHRLIDDPNTRVRLVAAGAVLAADPTDRAAATVVTAALSDPALRLRQLGLDVVTSLGDRGVLFLDVLHRRAAEEVEPDVRDGVASLITRLEAARVPAVEPAPDETTGAR